MGSGWRLRRVARSCLWFTRLRCLFWGESEGNSLSLAKCSSGFAQTDVDVNIFSPGFIQKIKLVIYFLFCLFPTWNGSNTFFHMLPGNIGSFFPACAFPPPSVVLRQLSADLLSRKIVSQREKQIVQRHPETNDKQRDNPVFVSGGGESCSLEGWVVITGSEVRRVERAGAPALLLDSTSFFSFFLSAAIFSAVAAPSIKGGGDGRNLGRQGEGRRVGEPNINGVIVGRSGAASPLTGVWGATDSSFSSGFSASDDRPSRFFPKESLSSRGWGGCCCCWSLFFQSSCASLQTLTTTVCGDKVWYCWAATSGWWVYCWDLNTTTKTACFFFFLLR